MYTNPWAAFKISTHTPRAGSDPSKRVQEQLPFISTHTPRAGSDQTTLKYILVTKYFNPHSPCGE